MGQWYDAIRDGGSVVTEAYLLEETHIYEIPGVYTRNDALQKAGDIARKLHKDTGRVFIVENVCSGRYPGTFNATLRWK